MLRKYTDYYPENEKMIREEWFKDHVVAPYTDPREVIVWRSPNSIFYLVKYVLVGGALIVLGDLGEAIYRWYTSDIDFRWISGCELGYFASKCEASEVGKQFVEWNRDVAISSFEEIVDNELADYTAADRGEARAQFEEMLALTNPWRSLKEGKHEWYAWIERNGYEVFGDVSDGWLHKVGEVIHLRCQAHLIGLKMAMEWLSKHSKE